MNIVFFKTAVSNSGGMERVSIFIANELANNPQNKVYYVSRVSGNPFFPLSDKIKLLTLSDKEEESLYLNWPKYIWKISRIIKKYQIEKWIDVGSNMALISVPAKMFARFDLFVWEHFNLTYVWNPYTTNIARWLACHFAKKVIVLTNTDRDRFEERFRTGNLINIPNPITIKPLPSNITKEKIILAVGRLTYQKGFDMMLEIWNMTSCKDNGWKLVIIGDGELRAQLKEQITRLDLNSSVSLLATTTNIEEWYAKASIYMMTSRWEGLPLVLIESLSAGLPIISFDCETGPKDIVEDGCNGFLIKCFDYDMYAEKLSQLASDGNLRETFSQNAIQKSINFCVQSIVTKWNNIL